MLTNTPWLDPPGLSFTPQPWWDLQRGWLAGKHAGGWSPFSSRHTRVSKGDPPLFDLPLFEGGGGSFNTCVTPGGFRKWADGLGPLDHLLEGAPWVLSTSSLAHRLRTDREFGGGEVVATLRVIFFCIGVPPKMIRILPLLGVHAPTHQSTPMRFAGSNDLPPNSEEKPWASTI